MKPACASHQREAAIISTEARERYAALLNLTSSELRLMAGEMTPQEMRTVKAVLGGITRKMLRDGPAMPGCQVTAAGGAPAVQGPRRQQPGQ